MYLYLGISDEMGKNILEAKYCKAQPCIKYTNPIGCILVPRISVVLNL